MGSLLNNMFYRKATLVNNLIFTKFRGPKLKKFNFQAKKSNPKLKIILGIFFLVSYEIQVLLNGLIF